MATTAVDSKVMIPDIKNRTLSNRNSNLITIPNPNSHLSSSSTPQPKICHSPTPARAPTGIWITITKVILLGIWIYRLLKATYLQRVEIGLEVPVHDQSLRLGWHTTTMYLRMIFLLLLIMKLSLLGIIIQLVWVVRRGIDRVFSQLLYYTYLPLCNVIDALLRNISVNDISEEL